MTSRGVRWLALLAVATGLGACTSSSTGHQATLLNVFYSVGGDASVVLDSVKYDNGGGTLVKVATPAITWTVTLAVPEGSTVEAHLYGHVSAGEHVKLKAQWLDPGYSTDADSTTFSSLNPTAFSIGVPKRQI